MRPGLTVLLVRFPRSPSTNQFAAIAWLVAPQPVVAINQNIQFCPAADGVKLPMRQRRETNTKHKARQSAPRGEASELDGQNSASGTTELGSCLTDATRERRSRRAVRKVAATLEPKHLR